MSDSIYSEKILKKRKLSENDNDIEVTSNERVKNSDDDDSKEEGEIQNESDDSDCELIEDPPPPLIVLDSTFASISSADLDNNDNEDEDASDNDNNEKEELPKSSEYLSCAHSSSLLINENLTNPDSSVILIENDNSAGDNDSKNTEKNVTTKPTSPTNSVDPAIIISTQMSDDNETTITEEETPNDDFLFRIEFKNDKIFNEYKDIITMGVQQCFQSINKFCEIIEEPTNFTMAIHENQAMDNGINSDIFQIDVTPTAKKIIMKDVVPEYRSSSTILFNDNLNDSLKSNDAADDARPMRRANLCFNCNGEHAIRDCKEPKNFAKIRANRQRFSVGKTAERYHIDVEQKFAKYQPGVISDDLQMALGLQKNELPMHILKMRALGYPPGWFENAKVQSSGLQLIGSQDNNEKIQPDNVTAINEYDLKKLIKYPGFNVNPSRGTRDNHLYYRLPPMMPYHSLDTMMKSLKGNTANTPYKRKKMKISHPNESSENTLESSAIEMEIDSDSESPSTCPRFNQINVYDMSVPPPPPIPPPSESIITAIPNPPPPPPEPLTELEATDETMETNSTDVENNSNKLQPPKSPTLDDLDEQKRRILAALDDSTLLNSTNFSIAGDDSLIDEILALDATSSQDSQDTSQIETDNLTPEPKTLTNNIPRSAPINIPTARNSSSTSQSGTKEIVLGTPVLNSVSPFSLLPNNDAWAVGVSDIIDFENLPDSTGKYMQMKSVIGKIRQFVKQQQDYDDDDEGHE